MALDDRLIEILCCPVTRKGLKRLEPDRLKKFNERIDAGGIRYKGGDAVEEPLDEALITEDGQIIYAVRAGIPILLEDKSIPADQTPGDQKNED
ncbi:MAG: Trm112 family protein [Planctomycetota bacterium]